MRATLTESHRESIIDISLLEVHQVPHNNYQALQEPHPQPIFLCP